MPYQYVREPLTADESDHLSNACETPTKRLVVWTLLDTGLRVGELCALTSKNVLWQQRQLRIKGKGGPHGTFNSKCQRDARACQPGDDRSRQRDRQRGRQQDIWRTLHRHRLDHRRGCPDEFLADQSGAHAASGLHRHRPQCGLPDQRASAHFTATVSPVSPGEPTPRGTVQFKVDGVNFGQAVTLVNGAATSRVTSTRGAGNHTVTAVDSSDNSYAGNSGNRGLTVAKALLTVTAVNETRKQGAANPALTYTITGFVNGDKSTVVKGKPTLSTTAVKTSPVGSYPINVALGTLSVSNYYFTLVPGKLTVTGLKAGVAVAHAPDSEVSPSPFDRLIPTWWKKRLSRS
jgi:hypothetical protein